MTDPYRRRDAPAAARSRPDFRSLSVTLFAALLCAVAPLPSDAQMAHIVALDPPTAVVLPGEAAVSALTLEPSAGGSGDRADTVWIGYSVQNPLLEWHDVPAEPLRLAERRTRAELRWIVPAAAVEGFYLVIMAVWSRPPGDPGAVRLASAREPDAFRVARRRDFADRLDTERWVRGEHGLGRGGVAAANTLVAGRALSLRLPSGNLSGAEIRSTSRHASGRFTARLRTPDAPGSLTAFFLYEDVPDGNEEIDIEIFNDGSRRALVTGWVEGEMARQAEVELPFDPGADFHDYTIDHQPGVLNVLIDGVPVVHWESTLPTRPMRVMLNAWWPTWLEGLPPGSDRYAVVESVSW